MGCGSSSLKGEAPGDVNPPAQPSGGGGGLKKTTTNFANVDYEQSRDPTKASVVKDRAPHEMEDEGPSRGNSAAIEGEVGSPRGEGDKLGPYQTLEEDGPKEEKLAGVEVGKEGETIH